MNPDDKGGLEMALRLKDKYGANVTVITMGPPQADLILREAFAMGVDRAILLLTGSSPEPTPSLPPMLSPELSGPWTGTSSSPAVRPSTVTPPR